MVSTICLSKYFCVSIDHTKKSIMKSNFFLTMPQSKMFIHMYFHASQSSPYVCSGISVSNVSCVL